MNQEKIQGSGDGRKPSDLIPRKSQCQVLLWAKTPKAKFWSEGMANIISLGWNGKRGYDRIT
jgi:hypothetical protein